MSIINITTEYPEILINKDALDVEEAKKILNQLQEAINEIESEKVQRVYKNMPFEIDQFVLDCQSSYEDNGIDYDHNFSYACESLIDSGVLTKIDLSRAINYLMTFKYMDAPIAILFDSIPENLISVEELKIAMENSNHEIYW